MKQAGSWLVVLVLALSAAPLAGATAETGPLGKIIVNHDEWTFSNTGFSNAADTDVFVANVASFFAEGQPGNFRAWSSNFGLTQSSLAATMAAEGHTWTVSTAGTFDLATLSAYDGIFLMGAASGIDTNVLIAYVNAGGAVYVGGGTGGPGGASGEAAYWNPFLSYFGLGFAPVYNGIGGAIAVNGAAHDVTAGVASLYYNNGNTVTVESGHPLATIVAQSAGGAPLVVVYEETSPVPPVPELATLALVGAGVIAVAFIGLRRRG